MAAANPLWGAPRIHGELGKLGLAVSGTVSRLLPRPRRPPSQTWRTFLTNHVAALSAIDFLSPYHGGSFIFNITDHPTAAWTAQQIIDAFPHDTAPPWLLRDRDAIYAAAFRHRVAGMGIREPSSPWQNLYAERLVGSIRRDCLNHVIVLGERICAESSPALLRIIMERERISHWPKTRQHPDACKASPKATRSHFGKSAGCTTVTNDAPPDVTSSGPHVKAQLTERIRAGLHGNATSVSHRDHRGEPLPERSRS